jgi:selenide,water dikinase
MTSPDVSPRLTRLAHGGGCGCKISPKVLRQIVGASPLAGLYPDLMVGTETSDDAAVWRLNADQALIATTDFFMPVVDDPRHFGAIAATNALSDIYAMGGRPILALAIVGMPVNRLPTEVIAAILEGGREVCARAGVPVAGGHSIDSVEPFYGLVALGLVHPDKVLTNRGGRPGDALILTKPLGVGVLSAAFKQGRLDAAGYDALIATATRLNDLGAELGQVEGVHALTDVTGFGLLGHALEMARGAGLAVEIEAEGAALLPGVEAFAREGLKTGASGRNWESYGEAVRLPPDLPPWRADLLTDPQTSGGLLIAVAAEAAEATLDLAWARGLTGARRVGRLKAGEPLAHVLS